MKIVVQYRQTSPATDKQFDVAFSTNNPWNKAVDTARIEELGRAFEELGKVFNLAPTDLWARLNLAERPSSFYDTAHPLLLPKDLPKAAQPPSVLVNGQVVSPSLAREIADLVANHQPAPGLGPIPFPVTQATVSTVAFPGSSVLHSGGYDYSNNVLQLRFLSGKIYNYKGVPPATFDELRFAASAGQFYNDRVKGRFEADYIGQFNPKAA